DASNLVFGGGLLGAASASTDINQPRARIVKTPLKRNHIGSPLVEKMVVAAQDFLAVVLQHEIDHLHGMVFLDRMQDLTQLAFADELQTYWTEKKAVPIPEI
ncbi:MAG: peptide deformylase, partial [Nitrospinae bacterium]|nr:peptide deformylase [Nitrospinota bacterium]